MSIIEQIKKDQIKARKEKAKFTATVLTTLIGEAETVGKNVRNGAPTDQEVQDVIRKFIKGANDCIKATTDEDSRASAEAEIAILEAYLPQQLTEEELESAIKDLVAEGADNMGAVMKSLKEKHGGLYDGRKASELVKKYL